MTMQNTSSVLPKKGIGDRAVDGLLAGISAGVVMALFLITVGLFSSESPAKVLSRFDPVNASNMVTGLLTHLAVSAIYGVIFGLLVWAIVQIRSSLLRFGWLVGLFYGLALYAVARGAFWAGVDSGLMQFTAVVLFLAHAVYGLVLGLSVRRKS